MNWKENNMNGICHQREKKIILIDYGLPKKNQFLSRHVETKNI